MYFLAILKELPAKIVFRDIGKKKFIGGGEESYGYLAGEFVRDKDAVMACMLIAEAAAWAKEQGKTYIPKKFENGFVLSDLDSLLS